MKYLVSSDQVKELAVRYLESQISPYMDVRNKEPEWDWISKTQEVYHSKNNRELFSIHYRNPDGYGILLVDSDIVKDMSKLLPIRRNLLLNYIGEWYEENVSIEGEEYIEDVSSYESEKNEYDDDDEY